MTSFDLTASNRGGAPFGAHLRTLLAAPGRVLDISGEQFLFYGRALRGLRLAVTRYRHEVVRLLAGVTFGTGALAMIGGTVVTVAFLTSFAGIELGLQGYSQLRGVGIEALSGFISAYVNTRLVAPVIAGIALVATVGAGFTAQLGAMRVSEEIDALEVMSIHTIPYLVSTRIAAGFAAVAPLYAVSVLASYACTRVIVVYVYGQSAGAYGHYFATFLIPVDIAISFVKVLAMAVVTMAISCYYGYNATGGPAGVGRAVGRAVRLSLISILLTDMLLSLALYGSVDTLQIAG